MNDRHFSSPILKRRIHATGCRLQKRQKLFERLELRHLMSADAVLDWNEVALQAVANDHTPSIVSSPDQGGPTRTSRALGIVHAAIFDAANAIDRSFTPYQLRSVGPTTASIDAAVAQAAYDTLSALYPKQAALFDAALASTLDDVPDGMSEAQGIAIGGQAAKANLDARRNDRSNLDGDYFAIPIPGRHRVDPLHPDQPYLTPDWGKVKPFTLKVGSQFRSDPPPRLSSLQYAAAFNEVKRLGGDGIVTPTDRSPEQTAIGIYWGYDGTPGLGTPPRMYNQIVRTVAEQQGTTEVQNARLFALVNLAMADAGIASWETKYAFDFWRPILGIREASIGTGPWGLGDFNPRTTADVTWTPLGAPASNSAAGGNFTPPFPAYTSGHATFGAATFRTLERFFGRDDIAFSFQSDEYNGVTTDANGIPRLAKTRSFNSFSDASLENAESRIYLGIHWRFDATAGMKQGNSIADWAYSRYLRPTHHAMAFPIASSASSNAPQNASNSGYRNQLSDANDHANDSQFVSIVSPSGKTARGLTESWIATSKFSSSQADESLAFLHSVGLSSDLGTSIDSSLKRR
jgi:PAP2 superfamily